MKVYKLLFPILAGMLFLSCEKEPKLSCNPQIDVWAKENVDYYESSEFDEMITLPLSRQRALFRGFSPEKKVALWKYKLNKERMRNNLSAEEWFLYESLVNQLTALMYIDDIEGERINCKTEEWIQIMSDKYEWDRKKIFFYIETWLTEEEYFAAKMLDAIQTRGIVVPGDETYKDCDCRIDIGCGVNMGECNKKKPCNVVEACGPWGHWNCYGVCSI